MGTKLTEETTKRTIELEGDIIHTKRGYSALLSQSEYGIYFSNAVAEIASNKQLNKLDIRLLLLLLSHLTTKGLARGENRVTLLRGQDYAESLNSGRPNIVASFKRLEELNYIKRDKQTKSIYLTVNPAIGMREKVNDIDRVWNVLAIPFGNNPVKEKKPRLSQPQDFNSSLKRDLKGKIINKISPNQTELFDD